MQILVIVLLALVLGIQIYNAFFRKEKTDKGEGFVLLQQQLAQLRDTMDERMGEASKAMQEGSRVQFKESRDLIQEINREVNEQLRRVTKEVSEVSESNKKVFDVSL